MQEHKTLAEAVLAVMRDVHYVQKTSAKGLAYTFLSERDIISKLRPAMVEHGIIGPVPIRAKFLESERYKSKGGSEMSMLLVSRVFRFTHVGSKEFEDVEVLGEAADAGDKRAAKAMTLAKKYALREFFGIETGDDPDEKVAKRDGMPINLAHHGRAVAAMRAARTLEDLTEKVSSIWTWMHQEEERNGVAFNDEQISDLERIRDHQIKALGGCQREAENGQGLQLSGDSQQRDSRETEVLREADTDAAQEGN